VVKNGWLGVVGLAEMNCCRAVIGQSIEPGMAEICMTRPDLFCMVLDHLRIIWAPGGANMMSPLAKCLVRRNAARDGGMMFEMRKKAWKASKKMAE